MLVCVAGSAQVVAEQPLGYLMSNSSMLHCLDGPRDYDEESGAYTDGNDFEGFSTDDNLYFINACSEPISFWVCSTDWSQTYQCSNEPVVPPGTQSTMFGSISGEDYYFEACPVGENACNQDALEWYRASQGAPRGTDLSR